MSAAATPVRMPALFVGHGSPMNAIEDNEFTRVWRQLAPRIPAPSAVLCISAHWQTQGVQITGAPQPETIHDFHGFPAKLSELRYPAPGHPALAQQIAATIRSSAVQLDPARGLDHGAWSVLIQMYPKAQVPILQLSLDATKGASFHYRLGRELAPLRDQGVLILASGNIVHNLGMMAPQQRIAFDWAVHANEAIKNKIVLRDHRALIEFSSLDRDMALAVPSAEHFLPLLYLLGVQDSGESASFFNDRVVMGAISMTGVIVGG